MQTHTILTNLTLSVLITTTINAYAGDWQISCTTQGDNSVYLIPNESIKDTGIGTKSAEIIAINRDRTDTIEYYKKIDTTKIKNPLYSTETFPTKTPWDLKVEHLEVDCDTKQYHSTTDDSYYYNGNFLTSKFTSTTWFEIPTKSVINEHANVICGHSTGFKTIKNLKSTADNLDLTELVTLGRDILKNTSNYYDIQADDSTEDKPKKSLFDTIFKAKY